MKKQLEEFFGCPVNVKKYNKKIDLPIFMMMRPISIVEIYGTFFALVDIRSEVNMSVSAMRKQQKKYEEAILCPVAYEVSVGSVSARNSMVKNGIAFIDLPGNVFLPFLGIVLQDAYKKQLEKIDRMMPATQMVFLELLYMEEEESALKSEIAKRLGLTKTSITRATAQLKGMDLITESKSGTEIAVKRNCSRKEYYNRAKAYLINPIQKEITVVRNDVLKVGLQAGETALSNLTDLNPPSIDEIAIRKGADFVKHLKLTDARFEEEGNCVNIQLWKYEPSYFAINGVVDPVSLACTFNSNEDERIEMCIEKILEVL